MPKTVLVVEDEAIVAVDIAEGLKDAGWSVLGPAGTVKKANALIEAEMPDAALLDVNLSGEQSFEFASLLRANGVEVLFLTGYSDGTIPQELSDCPILGKPVDADLLLRKLESVLTAP